MNLEWLNEIGLVDVRKDTGVLGGYPLGARIAVVEQVITFFDREYEKACEGMTHLAHLKWHLECFGAAFTLPLPSCHEVVSKAIKLYRTWLKEPHQRPGVVSENIIFLTEEVVRHLSMLFEQKVHPTTQTNKDVHIKLCTAALDLLSSLGHHSVVRRDTPTSPEEYLLGSIVEAHSLVKSNDLNGKFGKVVGHAEGRVLVDFSLPDPRGLKIDNLRRTDHSISPQNWTTIVKVLLGICDYTIMSPNGLKEMEYMAVSVLFECLLRAKIYTDDLWATVSGIVPTWTGCMAAARQWSAAIKALTLSMQEGIQKTDVPLEVHVKELPEVRVMITWEAVPKGFRKVSEVEMSVSEAMSAWRRFLEVIGNPVAKEPKVFSQAMHGLRILSLLISYCNWYQQGPTGPLVPQASPCAGSLFSLIGPWLTDAIPATPDTLRREGQATALTTLTDMYLRMHQGRQDFRGFLRAVKGSVEQAAEPLTDDHTASYRYRVLEACKQLFSHRVEGVREVRGAVLALLGRVIRYQEARGRGAASIPQHVEDFDTDDEFDGLLEQEVEQDRACVLAASDEDEGSISPGSARPSPTHKAREGSLIDGCDAKTRAAAFSALSSLIPYAESPRHRVEIRQLLLRALRSEREPRCLSTVLQICTQWIHHEMHNLPPTPIKKLPPAEKIDESNIDTPTSALTTVSHIISEVQLLLEGIQGWARQTVEVYFAAIKTMQHGALPYCSVLTSYPPPGHPAREALAKAVPTLPDSVVSSMSKFILYLHGKQNKDFNEASIGMLCSTTLTSMTEWISHCPSIVTHKETVKEVMDAVEIALGMKNSEALSLPSDALSVFRACMCNPHIPPHPAPERTNVPSEVSEAHLASAHAKRYFALDGTKILTVINHTRAKEEHASLHSGGITTIVRDAFGRHVWDARLHLARHEDESERTRPSAMIHRRHGISLGPERSKAASAAPLSTIEEAFEPLVDLLPEVETDEITEEMKRAIICAEEEADTECDTVAPMVPPLGGREPDQGRLFLSHLQLLSSSGRVVELKDTPELQSALAMVDMTPSRELHRISVVYLHGEDGCASLQDLGVEWYVGGDGVNAAGLPSFADFTSFVNGMGWLIDPSEHPQAYSGGAVGERWRRQRIHYYADTRCEAVWAVSAATPTSWENTTDLAGEKWEDKTPVRVIWNDTRLEYNPTAMTGGVVTEMNKQLPSWSPRASKTLDFVLTPIGDGLISVRVILPLANDRWQSCLQSAAFDPAVWHSPLVDGAVVAMSVLPVLLRQACISASSAFRLQWQRLAKAADGTQRKGKISVDPPQRQGFTYMAPVLTRAMLLQRYCSGLVTVSGVAQEKLKNQWGEGTRVSCVRHIELKSGRKLIPGMKGVMAKSMLEGNKAEIYFDSGLLYEARVGQDVIVESAVPCNWEVWRGATRCLASDLGPMFSHRD